MSQPGQHDNAHMMYTRTDQALEYVSLATVDGRGPAQCHDVRLEARNRVLGVLCTVAQLVDVAGRPDRSTAPGHFPGLKRALARGDFRGRASH